VSDEYEIDGMVVGPEPTAAPSAPEPYDFEVRWSDSDQQHSTYSGITGSSYDGNRVMLFRADTTWVLNFDEIQAIAIRKSDEF
jgi:hypothetical protein